MFSASRSFIVNSLALFLLLSAACQASNDNQTILIIGDSLSAGYGVDEQQSWVALLQNQLAAEGYGYRVINASISGDTTGGGLRRLPRALEQHDPGIVLIELGGNDGLRGTPVPVIRRNLGAMIEMCQEIGARVLLAGMYMPPNYGAAYTEEFADIYRDLADDHGTALITFFMHNVALEPALMQADGIHPNTAGQSILLKNVWPVLEPLIATQ
jgi:acyl-CoA thioesterase-1